MIKAQFLLFWLLFSLPTYGLTVLIDPGHGGKDDGAKGFFKRGKNPNVYLEKDITLDIAKKIKKKLKGECRIYLTRTIDRSVSLQKRAEMAEKISADLFISIHVNGAESTSARGFETFYLDNHDDAAVKKVEEVENVNLEGDELVVRKILTDLLVDRTVDSSKKLANLIHSRISKNVSRPFKMRDRGVKPGLFYVLALSKRPSILLEAGFISNHKEASTLSSNKFKEAYASAVSAGILQYIKENYKQTPALF